MTRKSIMRGNERWTKAKHPLPQVKVMSPDGAHTTIGRVLAWTPVRVQVRVFGAVCEFYRSDGRLIAPGIPNTQPKAYIAAESLMQFNAFIGTFERQNPKPASTGAATPTRSAHVLVTYTDVGVAVAGNEEIVRFFTPVGYAPKDVAEKLERIIAWAEREAATNALRHRYASEGGRASAGRRKTVRTKRRGLSKP